MSGDMGGKKRRAPRKKVVREEDAEESKVLVPSAVVSPAGGGIGIAPELVAAYARPSTYAKLIWGQMPYPWQARAMDALAIDGNRVCVATNNASGKTSFLMARGCLWYMDAFPQSVVVTTSASARQVQQQLYPNLRACIKAFPNAGKWKVRDNNLFWVKAPNGSVMFSFATNEAGRAEGYHIPDLPQGIHRGREMSPEWQEYLKKCGLEELSDKGRLLVVIDEAKSVDIGIFEAFERCRASNWLIASTPPTDPVGPFFDCFTRDKEKFRCVQTGRLNLYGGFEEFGLIGYDQCPHLLEDKMQMKVIETDLKTRGADDAFVMSMHLGKFPTIGQSMIFNMQMVEHAMSEMVPRVPGSRSFCCDFSGGGDSQPFGIRDGNHAWIAKTWKEKDSVKLADMIITELRTHRYDPKVDEFIGDNGGIGESCNDILVSKGIFVRRFDFRAAAKDSKKYKNVRAEGYFELAKMIALKQIRLNRNDQLKEQLAWHRYVAADDRTLQVTAKKNMPHSPDEADVIMMLFYGWQPPRPVRNSINASRSACSGGLFDDSNDSEWQDPSRMEGILF